MCAKADLIANHRPWDQILWHWSPPLSPIVMSSSDKLLHPAASGNPRLVKVYWPLGCVGVRHRRSFRLVPDWVVCRTDDTNHIVPRYITKDTLRKAFPASVDRLIRG